MHYICPSANEGCSSLQRSCSFNGDCQRNILSINSTTSNTLCTSMIPNHDSGHCSMMHNWHERSSTASANSSSCDDGAVALTNIDLAEGHGESSCDQHSAWNSSISRTHLDAFEYGECPSDRDMVASGCRVHHRPVARTANHRFTYLSKDIEQEQEYFQQILGSSSYGWTDEKHSSYLDSMEAEFLRSVMFRGNVPAEDPSSELSDSASSHQAKIFKEFKLCQNGRWRLKSLHPSYVGPLSQVAVAVKNPWIKRFRSPLKSKVSPLVLEDSLLQVAMDSRRR
ncbi:hypothetical protein GOP47_0022053 [Adiantum capillus-veneris]|uniref:Uncharacterized protein n=1 Tax=Adiantum capillus-veneris TaxID=13818 RepID=A0A9D4Z8F5_ADICA|nr:hypothetical protein GOP47_0022053 [Adiantum capillus-veneris]